MAAPVVCVRKEEKKAATQALRLDVDVFEFFLLLVDSEFLLSLFLFLFIVAVVSLRIDDFGGSLLECEYVRADAVEEPAVVTHDDAATVELSQRLLQCAKSVHVKIVGRPKTRKKGERREEKVSSDQRRDFTVSACTGAECCNIVLRVSDSSRMITLHPALRLFASDSLFLSPPLRLPTSFI